MTAEGPKSTVAAFAAEPTSCAQARTFVRESLDRVGIDPKVVDKAVLVTSELVTNAVLHAHAGPVVTVHSENRSVRIEVEDNSELFPLLRDYNDDAVTGRGLDVVEASATNWGVETTQNGKTVWAEFALESKNGETKRPRPALDTSLLVENLNRSAPDAYPIVFREIPVDQYLLLEQHHEALLREFDLLTIGTDTTQRWSRLSPEVIDLVKAVQPILTSRLSALRPQVATARAKGHKHCDLAVTCNDALIKWTKHFEDLMSEAERLSREGLLLTPPASPAILEMRSWFIEEMMRQYVDRIPPRPAPIFSNLR